MSEAIELYKADGSTAGIFYCSECRVVFKTEDEAKACHGERLCGCGKPIESKYNYLCQTCSNAEWKEKCAKQERERFESAKKVNENEYVGDMVSDGDKFYDSVEEVIDDYLEGQEPEYVWACKDVGVPLANSDGIVENLLENMWEDADYNDLNGLDELNAAIEKFNQANRSIAVWQPDYTTAILIGRRERNDSTSL